MNATNTTILTSSCLAHGLFVLCVCVRLSLFSTHSTPVKPPPTPKRGDADFLGSLECRYTYYPVLDILVIFKNSVLLFNNKPRHYGTSIVTSNYCYVSVPS